MSILVSNTREGACPPSQAYSSRGSHTAVIKLRGEIDRTQG